MNEAVQAQETQIDIDIPKDNSEASIELMQKNDEALTENENSLVEAAEVEENTSESIENINDTSNIVDGSKTEEINNEICEEIASQLIDNEMYKTNETEVKSVLEDETQSTTYSVSYDTEQQLPEDTQQSLDEILLVNTEMEEKVFSEENEVSSSSETVLNDTENVLSDELIRNNNNNNESSQDSKISSCENQPNDMDLLEKDSSLTTNSAATDENEEIDLNICDRYLEFYQNGDIYSIKTNKDKNTLLKNETSKYLNELSFGNFSSQCSNNFKGSDIKITTRSGQRSSSCPRQLPSIVSKLSDKMNGKIRKRRNSADSGISPETASPLKLRKTQENISDDECESIGKIEKFIEMTSKASSSDFFEDKPKESFTRSKT
ncbi:ABC transporter H family member 2-like [Centruroides vittatus]|uniref:ABC transporter H family member 2-like n=1 Tax=Centruroides vittatus TaxID=120091 RepID=UPI00350FB5F6